VPCSFLQAAGVKNKLFVSLSAALQEDYPGSRCNDQSILNLFSICSLFSRSKIAGEGRWIRDCVSPVLRHLTVISVGTPAGHVVSLLAFAGYST
jgi:hypothetical protein